MYSVCPLHKTNENCSLFWEFSVAQKNYQLIKCDKCDIVFYSEFPQINYEHHTDSIASLKDYVHLNSNIDGLIYNLLNNMPQGNYSTMLEVGCGFGFTLDFAKRILNMDVVGYEPSLYGELGAKELGIDIRRTYLTLEDVQTKKFDIIYLSEVLEHVEDPEFILKLLKEGLSEKGILIMTTPNYKQLTKDLNRPSELALLSPGAHVILFGPESLAALLKKVGLSHVTMNAEGNSLIATGAVDLKVLKTFEDKNSLIRKYYEELLSDVKPNSLTYIGVLYRLLRNYVDFGDYEKAHALLSDYPFPILPTVYEIKKIKTADELYNATVSCGSLLSYYIGIMKLNHYRDFKSAAAYFNTSYLLCKKKLELIPSSAVLEFEMLWRAKYHYSLALSNAGKNKAAMAELVLILTFTYAERNRFLPEPDQEVLKMANGLKERLSNFL